MATSIKKSNINRPAPRWFRITRTVVYGLFVGALFNNTLQSFGISDGIVNQISGWTIAIMETLGKVLANGEDFINVNKHETDVAQ